MNNLRSLLYIAFFALFTGNIFAHVALDYPVGGEVFQGEDIVEIEWHVAVPHGPANWDLLFSQDGGGSWEEIALDLPVTQLTYQWIVPNIETVTGRIKVVQDNDNGVDYSDNSADFTIVMTTGVNESSESPNSILQLSVYPNPFNPRTTITFNISSEQNEQDELPELVIYNLKGQKVKNLTNSLTHQPTNHYTVMWNGTDNNDRPVPSGVYYYRVRSGDISAVKKIMLLK